MRIPRIYQNRDLQLNQVIVLDAQATVHLTRVLRLRLDDPVILFNGRGGEYLGRLREVGKRSGAIYLERFIDKDVESALRIHLVQAVSRSDRMDYAIQKSVELGVYAIYPIISEHVAYTVNEGKADKKLAHWQGIAQSACEQCGRAFVPAIYTLSYFAEWLGSVTAEQPGVKLVLDCEAELTFSRLEADVKSAPKEVTLLVGPEGGLSAQEFKQLREKDFLPVKLGPRILRTETAAVAALAGLQTLWGDLA